MDKLRGPVAVRLSLGVLAVMFVAVAGLWFRASRSDIATRSTLQSELTQFRAQDTALRKQASADSASLHGQYVSAEAGLQAQTSSMFGAPDQVAAMVVLASLADRMGVAYSGLNVGAPSKAQLAGVSYEARSASISVKGSQADVTRFITAIQDDMIPGAALENLSLHYSSGDTSANLSLRIYTVPTNQVRFSPPGSLSSPAGQSDAAVAGGGSGTGTPREIAVGAIAAPVLTWSVQGTHAWTDALTSARFAVSAAPAAIQTYQLYAETTGDAILEPGKDRLLATAKPPADGRLDFALSHPYDFAAGKGQRFYLAVTVSTAARPGPLEATVPVDGMQFLSSAWPDAGQAAALKSRVLIAMPPPAFDLNESVPGGTPSRIEIPTAQQDRNETFVIISVPRHGTVSGGLPAVTYTPAQGFSGTDRFSYAISNGMLTSRVASVELNVTAVPGTSGTSTAASIAANTLISGGRQ